MNDLIDAINRLNNSIDQAEARQRAKEAVSAAFAVGFGSIPGFPPLPLKSDWDENEGSYLLHVDTLSQSQLMGGSQSWGTLCASYLGL